VANLTVCSRCSDHTDLAVFPDQATLSQSGPRASSPARVWSSGRLRCARLRRKPRHLVRRVLLGANDFSNAATAGKHCSHGRRILPYLQRAARRAGLSTLELPTVQQIDPGYHRANAYALTFLSTSLSIETQSTLFWTGIKRGSSRRRSAIRMGTIRDDLSDLCFCSAAVSAMPR
jgi:hypothetical protein